MIYIIIFTSSIIFACLASKFRGKNTKWIFVLFSILSIIIPALLAGMRDLSIGTDVSTYIINNYELARNAKSFLEYAMIVYAKEPLYMLIVYLVTKIFKDIHILLFVFSLIDLVCIYIGAYRLKKYISIPTVLVIYYFFYYNDTYNMVRQHMAMAVLFLGIINVLEKKYWKFLPYIIIATMLHSSAVLSIVFPIIHWFISNKVIGKNYKFRELLIVFVSAIVCIFPKYIYIALADVGILSQRYIYYFQANSVSDNVLDTMFYLMEISIVLLFATRARKKIYAFDYLKINAILTLIFLQLSRVMYYGGRFSVYFGMINMLMLAQLNKIGKNKEQRIAVNMLLALMLLIYWWYIYVYGGASETYPYKFWF